jgi:N-acyl-L-homoserine lactone synthetase
MFRFVVANEGELLIKVFRFRYTIACEELEVYKKEDLPDGLERDEYDPYSEHFALLDEEGEVAASIRFIHHSPIGYPTENTYGLDLEALGLEPEKVGEFSRIFIRSDYRKLKENREIYSMMKKNILTYALEIGIEYTLGSVEKRFYTLLRRFGFPYEIIGEGRIYAGKERFPVLMSTKKCIEENKELFEGMTIQ